VVVSGVIGAVDSVGDVGSLGEVVGVVSDVITGLGVLLVIVHTVEIQAVATEEVVVATAVGVMEEVVEDTVAVGVVVAAMGEITTNKSY
jgi:hypothetical protein